MANRLPPGIQYLSSLMIRASAPLFLVVGGLSYVLGTRPSIPLTLGGIIILYGFAFAAYVQYKEVRKRTTAKRLGAVLPKAVRHKYPGGVDLLFQFIDAINNRYPSTFYRPWPLPQTKHSFLYSVSILSVAHDVWKYLQHTYNV